MASYSFSMISYVYLCIFVLTTNAFNLSPKPNLIFKEPRLQTVPLKFQSSYFGLSLILRGSSLYVGAPRAQSSLPSQRGIEEPGVIYKCSIPNGQCKPFNFDTSGNVAAGANELTWDSENKDHQWLGAAMDGGPTDNDRMVVCAPRFFANSTSPEGYLMNGICYVAQNTLGDQPAELRKISPLRIKRDQTKYVNGIFYFYNAYAQMGFSVQCVEQRDEIIFGTPGLGTWKGSMITNLLKDYRDQDVSRSRRDIHGSRVKREDKEYVSEILQPELWAQQNDSYFGYSLTSGYFHGPNSTNLLYIASAPRSNSAIGESYLFSISPTRYGSYMISKHYTFEGTQFGEYFGYSILAEDVNGDNFTDVIVSAPNHYLPNGYENGAIYVFINQGVITFSEPIKITSGRIIPERFGTALSKLGDINLDGYNDIAVGAPFSGNGVVYLYLGGPTGLRPKPSQVIESQSPWSLTSQSMFGFGLSKGADIDHNGFNDLAIGEPNEDAAYLFRAYPVAKIAVTIHSPSQQLNVNQNKIQIKACWQLQTKSKNVTAQDVNFRLQFDSILKRVQISGGETNFKAIAKQEMQCKIYDATIKVSYGDVFRPIEIEMHFDLVKKIPDSNVFCETCVVIDPDEPNFIVQKIAFMTGCKSEKCVADLKLKSVDVGSPFIIGSSESITVRYIVTNDGENAYMPQINITSSNKMPFIRIPSSCQLMASVLECNLNDYRPLGPKEKTSIVIGFDATNLQAAKATIRAQVFSVGNESNPRDNIVEDVIAFAEYSQVEVSGRAITSTISLEDGLGVKRIKNIVEVRNHGPSSIKQMELSLVIPLAYLIPYSRVELPLIDFNNISVIPRYNDRILDVAFTQNGTILIQNSVERISIKKAAMRNNASTAQLPAIKRADILKSISDRDFESVAKRQVDMELVKELSGSLPINRTVFLNCYENRDVKCVEATFVVSNFHKNNYLNITFEYNIDLDIVNKLLIPEKDFFAVTTLVEASRLGDLKGNTIKMSGLFPNNIVSKHHLYSTPIWVYIVSIIGGLLILCGITYFMYWLGFFKRDKLQEMQAARHERPQGQESVPLNQGET